LIRSPFRDLPREVSSLVAASFFVAVGFGIVMPAIPVFAKSFGVNNAAIGVMVSAFAITRFASGLISGVLVDKFGERAVFSTGIFMVSAFTFLAGISQSYEQLLFFRAAGGLGSSMFFGVSRLIHCRRNRRPSNWWSSIADFITCTILCLLSPFVDLGSSGANLPQG